MADGGEDDSASELDEWVLPRCGSVPPLVFIGPTGSRQRGESEPSGATPVHQCNGGLLLIFPGGGYRKVEVEKEGRATARHFAAQGFVCCVADYQLAPFATFSVRAATAEPSLADAIAALEFVQTDPASGVGKIFQASRIALMGFSAGGHLSLCLLREVARAAARPEPEPEAEPTTKPGLQSRPPVAALMLVYPTIRNPCCWCIAGGLWILPGSIGAGWPANAEHVSIASHDCVYLFCGTSVCNGGCANCKYGVWTGLLLAKRCRAVRAATVTSPESMFNYHARRHAAANSQARRCAG